LGNIRLIRQCYSFVRAVSSGKIGPAESGIGKIISERLQGAKPATAHSGNGAKRAPSGEGSAATLPHCRPSRATLALDV
jgi:hypothetical protein